MWLKMFFVLVLGLFYVTSSFAGSEDWNGVFNVKMSATEKADVTHTPTGVKFLFFSAGKCLKLNKGMIINGIEIKEDVALCVSDNVGKFTAEVQKLGSVLNKKITLGPTYTD